MKFFKIFIFSVICGFFALPSVYASTPLNVTYSLYAGGFNVVDIEGTYAVTPDSYAMTMDMQTTGMLGKLAPWSGVIQSNGLNKRENSTPLKHSFASTWRDETETTTFTFNNDGTLKSHIRIKSDGKTVNEMPPSDVYDGAPNDMLSALFRTMNQSSCASSQSVLDGKRKFDMVFKSKGEGFLKQSKYSVFEGKAEICEVEIVPVAGKWRDKPRGWMSIQGQAKDQGQLPRLWFGRVRDDMPPIPVRFQIKTDYGTMIMHLKSID